MIPFSKWQMTCGPIVPDPSMEDWEYERIEWETTNERTVRWDKEQSRYLLAKLGHVEPDIIVRGL